jgi:hypothetical protein
MSPEDRSSSPFAFQPLPIAFLRMDYSIYGLCRDAGAGIGFKFAKEFLRFKLFHLKN